MKKSKQKPDHRDLLIHKFTLKPNLRNRTNAKCVECIYDPDALGTWREQVLNCSNSECPLFDVRPTTTSKKKSDKGCGQ